MSVRFIRHVHLSGKFTVTGREMRDALDVFSDTTKADVITLTEVSPDHLREPLRDWARDNHWHLYHPQASGQSECAILARRPIVDTRSYLLTHLHINVGRTAPLYLVCGLIEGGPWFATWHTPAHTFGLRPGVWATRVYLSALRGLKVARLRLQGHGIVVVADWNMDLSRERVRRRLKRPYRHLRWAVGRNQGPTNTGRVIDGVLTNLIIARRSVTLAARKGFDHRPILTTYAGKR